MRFTALLLLVLKVAGHYGKSAGFGFTRADDKILLKEHATFV